MEVRLNTSPNRSVVIEATVEEFTALYAACCPLGKRTKAHRKKLEEFGDLLDGSLGLALSNEAS